MKPAAMAPTTLRAAAATADFAVAALELGCDVVFDVATGATKAGLVV